VRLFNPFIKRPDAGRLLEKNKSLIKRKSHFFVIGLVSLTLVTDSFFEVNSGYLKQLKFETQLPFSPLIG
jgi:hypothetical protein